ncbi:MAG: DNA-formamidopyrimidine glycosylase family protein [Planctomycetota bacterium]
MPEGDTLYRVAANLRPVLHGQTLVDALGSQELSEGHSTVEPIDAASLVGRRIIDVRARGKHLMIATDDSRVIHSHLGMTGSWHVYPLGEPWRKSERRAGLALFTREHAAVLFSPKELSLVSATRMRRDDYVNRLGPDLMRPADPLAAILPRLRVHNAAPIGEAVMNQTIAAGIGNVYKSETLFLACINPWTRVGELSDEVLMQYLKNARRLMWINRGNGPRVTRFENDGRRHWVYGRRGEPCFKCGGVITLRRQGDAGRTTYWCQACQPATPRQQATGTAPRANAEAQRRQPPNKGCG